METKFMFKILNVGILVLVLFLTGCTGMFEAKTCGIKNSQWQLLTAAEQYDIEKSYHEKQRLADQLRMNKLLAKQQKEAAKARKKNEKQQQARLEEERRILKKQQQQIAHDLESKREAYHIENN